MKKTTVGNNDTPHRRAVYDRAARSYRIFDALIKGVRSDVVDIAHAPDGARILDVATGTGSQAFAFAQRGYTVVGIDLSEAMLDVALRRNTFNRVTFTVADAAEMPFEDGEFDVSCVSLALHEMPALARARVLREMVRVTAFHGIILIVEYANPPKNGWYSLLLRVAQWGEGKYFAGFVASDFRGLLTSAGIQIDREVPVLGELLRITRGINRGYEREAHI